MKELGKVTALFAGAAGLIILFVLALGIAFYLYTKDIFYTPLFSKVGIDETIFAKEYSEEAFNKVAIGMRREELEAVMGVPLIKTEFLCDYRRQTLEDGRNVITHFVEYDAKNNTMEE